MLLETKDGIKCDFCNVEFKIKFTYYNIEVTDVRANTTISFDMCSECFFTFVSFLQDSSKCEFCGKKNREFFIKIDEIEVDLFRIANFGRNVKYSISTFYICGECHKEHILGGKDG
jgi:hypothetical protein